MVHTQELLTVHYESEVEDDIVPIFRKGEVWNDILTGFCFIYAIQSYWDWGLHNAHAEKSVNACDYTGLAYCQLNFTIPFN